MGPLERAFAFERAMHGAVGRVVTAAWGQAFLSPALERCYDRNLLWVVGDGDGLSAAALDAHADRLLGGHGMSHRRLLVEPAANARLRAALVARGYEPGTHRFMAFDARREPPAVDPSVAAVVEVSIAALDAATERYLTTDPDTEYGRDPRTREHLREHHREYGPAGGAERRFAVVEDGQAVAALVEGAELVFIVADADDWPKALYARLGFADVGGLGVFQRYAPR